MTLNQARRRPVGHAASVPPPFHLEIPERTKKSNVSAREARKGSTQVHQKKFSPVASPPLAPPELACDHRKERPQLIFFRYARTDRNSPCAKGDRVLMKMALAKGITLSFVDMSLFGTESTKLNRQNCQLTKLSIDNFVN